MLAEFWQLAGELGKSSVLGINLVEMMVKKTKFELSPVQGASVSDNDLLSDLKRVAQFCNSDKVSMPKYKEFGTYDCKTISRRFGTWNKALLLAELTISNEVYISDDRLFENILNLWQHYGRQPRRRELALEPSTISEGPYRRRFRSWFNALKAFIDYANSSDAESPKLSLDSVRQRKINRDPSLRLRWKVLQRDRFTCMCCGASPAIKLSVQLQVDHIIPYSKGGETTLNNLQTLCSICNNGKSDLT